MERRTIFETVSNRTPVLETVEQHGLDGDLYLAVIDAELGRGGLVNANNRIYSVEEFVSENTRLGARVSSEFVDGEAGHPAGSPTFDVPVRLVSVAVESDGSEALAKGKFAILNTQVGRDIMTLYQAGMNVGVSSRGTGMVDSHIIDEDSPYWESNPSYRGKSVDEVSDFELLTYDLVRVPSAGTHMKPATQEAKEAYLRLSESGYLELSHRTEENVVAKKDNDHVEVIPAPVDNATDVGVEDLSALNEERIVKEATDAAVEAVRGNDPFASLSEAQRNTLIRLAAVIESADEDDGDADEVLAEQVKRVADQAEVDRLRLIETEELNGRLRDRVQALESSIEEARKAKEIAEAVNNAVENAPHGARIRADIEALVAEGKISGKDEIAAWADRLNSLVEGVEADRRAATGDAVIEAVDASDDLNPEEPVEESAPRGPGLLDENFAETLRTIIDKDRSYAGRA